MPDYDRLTNLAPWRCYAYCVKKVTFSEGITRIGNHAFNEMEALEELSIPSGVTAIGDRAFYNCKLLKRLELPATVKTLGKEAFTYCSTLTDLTLPKSLTSLGRKAFYHCDILESLSLPEGLTEIAEEAFASCFCLKRVTLPKSVKTLQERAFADCYALEKLVLAEGVESIAPYAFQDSGLVDLTLPASVTTLDGDSEFLGLRTYYNRSFHKTLRFLGPPPEGLVADALMDTDIYCKSAYYEAFKGLLLPFAQKLARDPNGHEYHLGTLSSWDRPLTLSDTNYSFREKASNPHLSAALKGVSSGLSVTWHSNNPKQLEVRQDGTLVPKTSVGSALVYAEATYKGYSFLSMCMVGFSHTQINTLLSQTLPTKGIKANYPATAGSFDMDQATHVIDNYWPNMYIEADTDRAEYKAIAKLTRSLTENCASDREKVMAILD